MTEAVDAILDVIAGLEAAFAGGVLHRDIKPSNCFVSPDGAVKVGDFGLSVSTVPTAETFATLTGKIMGTPAYAPPEQLRGRELDVIRAAFDAVQTLAQQALSPRLCAGTFHYGNAPEHGIDLLQCEGGPQRTGVRPDRVQQRRSQTDAALR